MAKSVHNDVLDAALNFVKNNCTKMVVCSAEPLSYTDANNIDTDATPGYKLAEVAMVAGDFVVADDVSGRKVTVAAKAGVLIADSGSATHIALLDTATSKVLYVTTCTAQALTANGTNTVSIPSWKASIADPT